MKLLSSAYLVLVVGLVSGCNVPKIAEPPLLVQGYAPNKEDLRKENKEVLKRKAQPAQILRGGPLQVPAGFDEKLQPTFHLPDNLPFADEWRFHREVKDTPPKMCLAMSGGGIRSAYFNIGVLKSLHESGKFYDIDAISAVSGGAYALGWYLAQHIQYGGYPTLDDYKRGDTKALREAALKHRKMIDEQLFKTGGPYQQWLADHAATFTTPAYVLAATAGVAWSPVNFFFNGVFGWHMNTTPARNMYETALIKTFLTLPEGAETSRSRVNNAIYFDLPKSNGRHETLNEFIERSGLPFFSINTTALIEDDARHLGGRFANAIYEFTPLQMGSDAFGRYRHKRLKEQYSLARVVSISGAAFDGTKLIAGNSQKALWSLVNQDLGFYINNPALDSPEGEFQLRRNLHRALPFPFFYFSPHYIRDAQSTDIYLSDGGHSDNLGVFSLARRLCDEIIVVDGTHNPSYVFDDFHVVKSALAREMNVEFALEGVTDSGQDRMCAKWSHDANTRTQLGYREKPLDAVDALKITDGDFWECNRLNTRNSRSASRPMPADYINSNRWQYYAQNPVLTGTIGCLPNPYRINQDGCDKIRITYVRLAFHPNCVAADSSAATMPLQERVSAFFKSELEKNQSKTGLLRPDGTFPQDPTTDQNYSREKFEAYRDLGYLIATKNDLKNDWETVKQQVRTKLAAADLRIEKLLSEKLKSGQPIEFCAPPAAARAQ